MAKHRYLSMMLLGIGIIGCLSLYYIIQAYLPRDSNLPQAQNGVIDLTAWDFLDQETVKLDGEWEFYWQQLLAPGEHGSNPIRMQVPGQWNKEGYPAKGAGTFRLIVQVEPSQMHYGLRISNAQMASALYINGLQLGSSGVPALTKETYTPENIPYTVYFPVEGEQVEILLHVANHDFLNGGITYSLHFGTMSGIQQLDKRITGVDVVVLVALFMIGIYHLGVYLKRRQETSLLLFGLYCLATAVAFGGLSDKVFMQVFQWIPFEWTYRLQVVAIYGSQILLAQFIRSIYSHLVPAWFIRAVVVAFGAFMLFVFLTPYHVYTHATFFFTGLQVIVYISIITMLAASEVRPYRKGNHDRRSIRILIIAIHGPLICMIDNSLYILGWLPTNVLGSVSMLVFTILISLMLAFNHSDAYKTIEAMSDSLLEADRLKDEFLINTSHELQTPLNGILNISQLMLKGEDGQMTHKQGQNLALIQEAARRLSTLVGDILDLERIKRNDLRLQLTAVDARSTAALVLELLEYLITDKEIQLKNRIPADLPAIHADESRFRQVLYNLVGNAIKFTERGSVEIAAEQVGQHVKLTVQDTGIGIRREEWQRMFQSFTQSDAGRVQGPGGLGLGLSISRQLIELMQGQIFIEASAPEQGTRIVILLPVSADLPESQSGGLDEPLAWRQGEPGRDRKPVTGASRTTILAVDDEPSNLQILRGLFGGEGYELLTAPSGRAALRVLEERADIDLVLLDVMMPGLSGYEVCRNIRSRFTLFDLPVVLMTARNTPHDIAQGFASGANDFIAKPYNAWEVQARVTTLVELKRSVRQALSAEMAFLQSQIKPHFLYNAMNAIAAVCYTDSEQAAQLIQHLGYYLRRSFDLPGMDSHVRLREEIKLVQSYVAIEKARFGERLSITYDVDEALLDCRVLPLTIQPLVENAIRHGIMKRKQGGLVTLSIRRPSDDSNPSDRRVLVEVADDGVGMAQETALRMLDHTREREMGGGVGLVNIHRRLLNLSGKGLRIDSVKGEGTRVQFEIQSPERNS
ncbi:ATP-binding protein [Paenibacillus daejeonensis]|uniref:ATP-binding protein n=1 Tax=Paenibacillus daejeonensis TaxID=135193 RepID=UPI00037391BD|nr:ATP-binding protein [Paenibacillus daejeonensis]